jgi:starch synthase
VRVAFVASEGAPFSRSGGLGEVTGALSAALHAPDAVQAPLESALALPLHRESWRAAALAGIRLRPAGVRSEAWLGGVRYEFTIYVAESPGRPVYLFDAPRLFDRDGIYHDANYRSWADNAERFAAFTKAAVAALPDLMGGPIDVLHAHDWQTALAPAFLRMRGGDPRYEGTRTVLTIHNLAHQGVFDKRMMDSLGLPWEWFHVGGLEFHDRLSFLKGGMTMSDIVTTVSPSYAREICDSAHGVGLDGVLRALGGRLRGLLNGIDGDAWDSRTDPFLPAHFDADDLSGKTACRDALLEELGLHPADASTPVVGVIGRLAWQKGVDLIAAIGDELVAAGCRVVLLGSGEPGLERQLSALAARHPGRVAARVAFDLPLSHRVEAGSDLFLMPSRFEPCGLNQMYSMAYGTIPVVHGTGGLRDTVIDPMHAGELEPTGFSFDHADADGLRWATRRAIDTFRHDRALWSRMQQAGMRRDWTWQAAAEPYRALYREISG